MADVCGDCGSEIAPGLLSCPGCRRLLHADKLKSLAAEAERARTSGDVSAELAAWRRAMDLLPEDARQREVIDAKIQALSAQVDRGAGPPPRGSGPGAMATGVGAAALLLWKFKAILAFVLTKGKLLLVGLTKSSTLLSMLLSFGVYWSIWGWKFAAGFIVSMYIHEMGHVAMLRRYGIRATAPMFIPGLGAFVRLNQYPASAREDARVGLAGPIWGLGAAVASWGLFLATGAGLWGAVARVGAWLNLFNLIPVWQLDGSRGFRSLSRWQRYAVAAAAGASFVITHEPMTAFIAIAGVVRCFESDAPKEADGRGLVEFLGLIAALSALLLIHLPEISNSAQ